MNEEFVEASKKHKYSYLKFKFTKEQTFNLKSL
jgi:hypothetical protein